MHQLQLPLGCPWWHLTCHASFKSGTRSGETELVCWLGFGGGELNSPPPPPLKPGGFGQHKVSSRVEVALGYRVLHWTVSSALSFCVWSEEIIGVKSPLWVYGLISGFNGGQESFHWHVVVAESLSTGSLGVALEMGVMQVLYLADTSSLFYHICSLGTNEILWFDFVVLTDHLDVVFIFV